jgi:Arc/MetJ-type ribon-helix-helix transcriptional regulator
MEIRLPPDQQAHLAELAVSLGRSADEIVREAVAFWEEHQMRRSAPKLKRTPAEAVARILERRKHHKLPEGETIRDLMTYGRA